MQIKANGIMLEVEEYGPQDGPPLILIRGLGSQLIHWPKALVQGFAERGYRTIIFDNRDMGKSQKCPAPGVASKAVDILAALKRGETPKAAYSLNDMAEDVIGLMDALQIDRAHIFGISMGGGITQILMTDHADRLLTATAVMTSSRLRSLELLPMLLAHPCTRAEFQDNWVKGHAFWGTPGFPMTESEMRAEAGLAHDRGWTDEGENRQVLAILAMTDRQAALRKVNLPAFIIHGAVDALVPPELGRELAGLVPGARLEVIDGMGHVITPLLSPKIVELVDGFITAAGK